MPFRRVVVGVDFTDTSLAAVRWASVRLAPDAEIVLAHVEPESESPRFLRGGLRPVVLVNERETALHGALCGLADVVGRSRSRVEMLSGRVADGLAAIAHRLGADAVCVGRSTARQEALFGESTASQLLTCTALPVIVAPATRPRVVAESPRPPRRPGPGGGDAA